MGIKNFHLWLHEKYPASLVPIIGNNIYEYIYIDLNFILHNSIYSCKTEKDFNARLRTNLNIIFSNFIATKEVFFAIDGPSSFAKIMLQRKRRLDHTKQIDKTKINSLCITPGISIMARFEKYIYTYIEQLSKRYKFIKPKFTTSFSNEPNEGEIKICKKVIENGKNNLNHRHLIIGNDSDLIVLAMGMKPVYNINILIKSKDRNEIVSIKNLLHAHAKLLGKDDKIENLCSNTLRDDFIFLSILMGNDYLPKVAFMNYHKVWNTYIKMMQLSNETIINELSKFNPRVTSNFFFLLFNTMNKGHQKLKTYKPEETGSYLEGVLWCVHMYKTGTCVKYDYSYNYESSPHPYELLLHICSEKDNITILPSDFQPIPSSIYPLVIMPRKANYLLTEKQKKLMETELNYLYEKEECEECHKLRKSINEFREKDEDKLMIFEGEYKKHIKTHLAFCTEDIHKIISLSKNNL